MDNYEMRTLRDTTKITEKMASFAGSLIMQLMQKQKFVEKQGMDALLSHIKNGGGTITAVIPEQRAEHYKELLKERHLPYVEIEHIDPGTKERQLFFVHRGSDRMRVQKTMERLRMEIDQSCHEVDLETFIGLYDKKSYAQVGNLTKEDVYAFRQVSKDYKFNFCVVADGEHYGIICNDTKGLSDATVDMAYNLSGEKGKEYVSSLQNYFHSKEVFLNRLEPKGGRPKYIVNARNPAQFISVDEQGITTHSIGEREEKKIGGGVRHVIYDRRHETYPGFDKEKLLQLALEFKRPIILLEEEFNLVQRLSKTKEAILHPEYMTEYKRFCKLIEKRTPDLMKVPVRAPMYAKENLVGYSNLPQEVIRSIVNLDLADIYVDGSDVAFPKECKEQVDTVLEEQLFKDLSSKERSEVKEAIEGQVENRAIDYMLQIEKNERSVLKNAAYVPPELFSDVQREVSKRLEDKVILEKTMNKEAARQLNEKQIDRNLKLEMDR